MALDDGLHPGVSDQVEGIKREFQGMARERAVDPMDNYQGEIAMHYMAEEIRRLRGVERAAQEAVTATHWIAPNVRGISDEAWDRLRQRVTHTPE